MTYTSPDPVLRLLPPEPPDAFLTFPIEEQAWRGRLWLAMYGAGYEPDHAWWFAISTDPDWEAYGKDLVARVAATQVADEATVYASMVRARVEHDRALAEQAGLPQ